MSSLAMCKEYNDVVAQANQSSIVHGQMATDMTQWENNVADAYTRPASPGDAGGILTVDYTAWNDIDSSDTDDKDAAYKKYQNDQTIMQTTMQECDAVVKPETSQVATNQTYIQNWTTAMGTVAQVQQFLSNHLSIK